MVSFFFDFYHPTQLHKSEKKKYTEPLKNSLGLLAQLSSLKCIAFFVLLSYSSKSAEVDSNNGRSVC